MSFDPEVLAQWRSTPEIEIETSRGDGAPVHRTTIWIVADDNSAYVRSVRGPSGRWYRELVANPNGAVHANARRVPITAQLAADAASIQNVSELLRQKYQSRWPGPTDSMLREEVLPTTLRLVPSA